MATTFKSREPIRKALIALYVADGTWTGGVFGYIPRGDEIKGVSPFMFITSFGTQQTMKGKSYNPATYTFSIQSAVLVSAEDGSWTETEAEDELDDLDRLVRQVIRDGANSFGTAAVISMRDTPSQVMPIYFGSDKYWVEQRQIDFTDLGS